MHSLISPLNQAGSTVGCWLVPELLPENSREHSKNLFATRVMSSCHCLRITSLYMLYSFHVQRTSVLFTPLMFHCANIFLILLLRSPQTGGGKTGNPIAFLGHSHLISEVQRSECGMNSMDNEGDRGPPNVPTIE